MNCCCSSEECKLRGCLIVRQGAVGSPQNQPIQPRGCICPTGSETTCRGFACPRQPFKGLAGGGLG